MVGGAVDDNTVCGVGVTIEQTIELDGVSMRAEGPRFDLVDKDGNYMGEVHPQRTPQIDNSGQGSIKRRLSSFTLNPSEQSAINRLTERVNPYWVFGDGTQYQLGVMLWADASESVRDYGSWVPSTLVDQGLILDQNIPNTIGFVADTLITDALTAVAIAAGFNTASIDASSATLGGPLGWAAGKTKWGQILTKLCGLAGFYDWYFTNNGTLRMRTMDDLTVVTPTLTYKTNQRVIANSIVKANDLLKAPNRYVAIDTAAKENATVGIYDLPDSAPHSIARRGFPLVRQLDAPGVASVQAAVDFAQAFAQTDPKAYETVVFDAAPDPRHETFDPVTFYDNLYVELSWSLKCAPGGPQHHSMKRIYLV